MVAPVVIAIPCRVLTATLPIVTDASHDPPTWITVDAEQRAAVRFRRVRIDVLVGPDAGASESFAQAHVRVGAHRSCDLIVGDPRVSAIHFDLELEDHGYRIRDLGSTNGTFVNGLRIRDAYVPAGASVRIGGTELRLLPTTDSVEIPLASSDRLHGLVGGSVAMRRVYERITRFAPSTTTVLITGETGTGKELVAEALHLESARRDGPLVIVDCGALTPTLFEAELFGHERGAFTGADRAVPGVFERADGGTLFLDEVGEILLDLQPKLLRAVESRRVRLIGGAAEIPCDVRVIAATHRELAVEVNRRAFRADLYYRLAVATIEVPPLRARVDDLPQLVDHFLAERGASARRPDAAELARWATHAWPGNVRELRNAVERLDFAGVAALDLLPDDAGASLDTLATSDAPYHVARGRVIAAFERHFVVALLARHSGNISAAARATGIDRMTLYKLVQRCGLTRE